VNEPTPQQMRELSGVLDRCADMDRNAVRVPLLHESAAALRAAAAELDQLRAFKSGVESVRQAQQQEQDRLRTAIENAPHGKGCAALCSRGHANYGPCDCWKVDVL
jgi:hypothetical protein